MVVGVIFFSDTPFSSLQSGDGLINRRKITEKQAREAMAKGEFGEEIIASRKHVAIILTQSWCYQWVSLDRSLESLKQKREYEIDIYELEYDKVDYFSDFLRFKENTFRNDLIPYVRYYTDGKLVGETNYVSVTDFLSIFDLAS